MGRLNKIFETEPAIRVPENPVRLAEPRGAVEFRSVSFRYPGTERLVLEDVSFVANPGQTVAVVGPTGSGKTTLVTLIPRIYDVSDGHILVDGVDVRDLDPGDLRLLIGMVPQDPFLFSTTIEENIGLGLDLGAQASAAESWTQEERRAHSEPERLIEGPDDAVVEAARVAQLQASIEGFSKGWGTLLGERGSQPFGGAEATHHVGPGHGARPANSRPRRRLECSRHAHRDAHSRRSGGCDGGADFLHHQPPCVGRDERGSHSRLG